MKFNPVLVAVVAVGLAACGSGDGSGSDATVLGLTSTNYVTVTQTPTTLTPTTLVGATIAPGTVHPEEGTYVIANGDFASTIATKFKVPFADLLAINGWTLVGDQVPEYPAIGTTIKIPPNWTEPGTVADTTTGNGTPAEVTTTVAGGVSTCAPGEYTIVEGDFEGRVATKLDTTVDALRAANANTANYSSFYPGLVIKTPPKANC
jgi:LysM repeat protein